MHLLKPNNKVNNTQIKLTPIPTIAPDAEHIMGNWVVSKNIGSSRYSTYSKEDIKNLIGKEITYNVNSISSNNKVLERPYYKVYMQSEEEFFEWYYTNFYRIGTKNKSIEVIEVYTDKALANPWDNEGNTVMVKDKDTLILYVNGEFFELNRK